VLGLSIADQQIVEIAKALTFDAKVLVMDEPTAALSSAEVERLFNVVKKLRAQGVALLFISHRLEEVFSISQRITILRDGEFIATRIRCGFHNGRGHPQDGRPGNGDSVFQRNPPRLASRY